MKGGFLFLLKIMSSNMKLTAAELYQKLIHEYKIIGQIGEIKFTVKDLSILIKTKDSVGNLLQEWLKAWFIKEKIEFEENTNSQTLPNCIASEAVAYQHLLQ